MTNVPIWFDRKFTFAFPVEQFPNVCIRLRGAPARLEEILQPCPRDLLITRSEGKWSAQEHAGHLLDLEPLWTSRIDDFLNSTQVLSAADLTNRKTDDANHNAQPLSAILSGFRSARLQLVDRVEKFPVELFSRSILHPRLKQPMRLVDHLYFVAEHDDHHLARIWELVRSGTS